MPVWVKNPMYHTQACGLNAMAPEKPTEDAIEETAEISLSISPKLAVAIAQLSRRYR
jgi:hypothetical protein